MTDSEKTIKVNKTAKPARIILSVVSFAALCIVLLVLLSGLLQPKYYFASEFKSPETEMWENFYALPDNSLTTVFVGASDVYCGVDAARFNDLTGESSFDMAVSSGSFVEDYYLLQEVLSHHSPRTVVLDMGAVTRDTSKNVTMSKRPFQDMKWTKIKWAALTDENRGLGKKDLILRFFTVFDYHDRWKELSEIDVHPDAFKTNVLGFAPCYEVGEGLTHDMFYQEEEIEYNEVVLDYFDRIVKLCRENDIELVLMKVPRVKWNISQSSLAEGLASKYGLEYIDYNIDENYFRIGIDDELDWRDAAHLNANGAKKFTDVLAEDLKDLIN